MNLGLICVAALAFVVMSPAVPSQASKHPEAKSHIQKQANEGKANPNAPPGFQYSPTPEPHQDPALQPSIDNKPHPVTITSFPAKDWADWIAWSAGILLVGIGLIGVFYGYRTLNVIEGQLKEIRAAGIQTASLIAQAEKHADAAKRSANALVNSERAWIMTEVKFSADVLGLPNPTQLRIVEGVSDGIENVSIDLSLICKNAGRTPAWITERVICFRNIAVLPNVPDFTVELGGDYRSPVLEPLNAGAESKTRWTLDCKGPTKATNSLVVYGFVKYRDIFSPERETRFAYTARGLLLSRFASTEDYWEYNKYT
jgi:hypothetical protein